MASRTISAWVLATLLCCTVSFCYTQGLQRYPFQIYSTNIGLSQSSVYNILKDKQGYIWVGTGDGLNRLTPTTVEVFKRDFRDSTGLYSNAIRGLIEDPDGNIWIGTDFGLNTFDPAEKKIQRRYKDRSTGPVIPVGIYEGQIVGMKQYQGIFCLEPNTGDVSRQYPFKDPFHTDTRYFTIAKSILWTITLDNRLLKLNLETGAKHIIPLSASDKFKNVTQVGPVLDNQLYIAADSSLYSINTETDSRLKFRSFDSKVLAFGFVNSDQIWVSLLGKGMCRINHSGELLEQPVKELLSSEREMINLRNISVIVQTNDSLVWLGIEGTGAVSMATESRFQWISKNDPYVPGLTNTFCRSIGVLNANEMILGTYLGGLSHIDLKAKQVVSVPYPPELGNDITTILPWQNETLFLNTKTGVWMVQGKVPAKLHYAKRISAFQTQHLARLQDELILATAQGLYAFDPRSDETIRLISPGYFAYAFTTQNKLYTASNDGIAIFDSHLQKIASGGEPLVEYGIKSLHVSNDEEIWVSTKNGLLEINPQNFQITRQYSTKEGLPDNFVYGVLSDGDLLWGSTNRGLFSLDRKTGGIRTFSQKDGLQGMEFNSGCFEHLGNNLLAFAGINGINLFDPDHISRKTEVANVVLKKIWINDKETDRTWLNRSLPATHRNFFFEWDVLQWTNPDKIRLECKLEGQDTGWVNLGNRNQIRYNALPPGNFNLLTRTVTHAGNHDATHASLGFRISPPFYLTWWFLTAATVGILLFLSALIYRRASMQYRKRLAVLERQKEMDDLRKRISRDIHDDVGSDLSKMRMLLLQTGLAQANSKSHYSKLQKLSEHALTKLSEVVWTINSDYDHLPQMVAWFRSFAYDFFDSEQIEVRFDAPEKIPEFVISPDLRRNVLMIYKEGLNNIIKHAGASEVEILFECSPEGMFRFSWFDNGQGFCLEKEKCGNGLKNMRRRAGESGLEISIQSTPALGTRISVTGILSQKYHENVTE